MCRDHFERWLLPEPHLFGLGGWLWAWREEEGLKVFLGDPAALGFWVGASRVSVGSILVDGDTVC